MNSLSCASPGEQPVLAVVDMIDRIGVGQHRDDDLAVLGEVLRRRDLLRARVGQRLCFVGRAVPHRDRMADFHQPRRHRGAHAAEPGNSDLHERPPRCPTCGRAQTRHTGDIMSAASRKGQVGIIGLGIMGGAIAKNLQRRRLAGDRLRHRERAMRRGEGRGRRDRRQRSGGRREGDEHPGQPAEARSADGDRRGDRATQSCRAASSPSFRHFHSMTRSKAEAALRAAGHAMLDCPLSRHRRAGAHQGPCRLRERRRAGDSSA